MTKGYLTTKQLCERYNCSARTLHRWMARDSKPMPKPTMCGAGSCNRWAIDDIEDWENSLRERGVA